MEPDQKCLLARTISEYNAQEKKGITTPVTIQAAKDSKGLPWKARIQWGSNTEEQKYINGSGKNFQLL